MSVNIKLKKGLDLNLEGKAKKVLSELSSETFAVKPPDFVGFKKPKLLVKVGDQVKAGDSLYFDKSLEAVKFTAPVSGEVVDIKRGAKRILLEIVIKANGANEYKEFKKFSVSDIANLSAEDVKANIAESGIWPQIIQRPFAVIANPADSPKSIFISGFDSAPLAPDYDFLYGSQQESFKVGIEVLKKLAPKVHLNINGDQEVSNVFSSVKGVQINKFFGPHPAGNVGVQIHHIDPIGKSDLVWTIKPYAVIQLGKLFTEGRYDATKIVALAGSEVANPQYYKTIAGAQIGEIVNNKLKLVEGKAAEKEVRVISGNVLTGEGVARDSHLGFYDELVTVIPEGNVAKFFGSFDPTKDRHSIHRAIGLLSFLNSKSKEYAPDTNVNGEHRAFVQSGMLEKVLPMDILPTYLIKAILAQDFDNMEALGLLEVAEEDFALCEYVDVSKNEIQEIIREGIDLMLNS